MAHLSLCLLGPMQVTLDGAPITAFASNKVRALLAYLTVESDRPHPREALAGLLWPERPDQIALNNLRYALSNLRQAIGDRQAQVPFLWITRTSLQFNPASDHSLDVSTLARSLPAHFPSAISGYSEETMREWENALRLCRGSYLEGFSAGSASFEEWILLKREQLGRRVLELLEHLAAICQSRGDYVRALSYVRRQLELEPWHEEGHRQLMRLLVATGQRSAALAQYETCRRLLARELAVEPMAETTALYESIRRGTTSWRVHEPEWQDGFGVPARPVLPTDFSGARRSASTAPFVGRQTELTKLDRILAAALAGQGQVAFISGEAGSGKTALVGQFARLAAAKHTNLIVAAGGCSAFDGLGDAFLPFREILYQLTGNVDGGWLGGSTESSYARRLAALTAESVQALLDTGPELIGSLLSSEVLVARVQTVLPDTPVLAARLKELARRWDGLRADSPIPAELFGQLTAVLQRIASRYPLLLILEDLQWADVGSTSLLFHLGRRLVGSRILIVGTFRPSDVALGRAGERHLLLQVVNELRQGQGYVQLAVGHAGARQFVDDLIDAEPNRLGSSFRDALHRYTAGQALFTVELLHGMQERGDLLRDEQGRWVESPRLQWEQLPTRVEAVLTEWIGRLPAEWRSLLSAASVEGEQFAAEVLAQVTGLHQAQVVDRLSGALSKEHYLICAAGVQRLEPSGQRLSYYRFRYPLLQKYLYRRLDEVERAGLHEATGQALATLYGERTDEIGEQLARHFELCGQADRAVAYLLQAAGRAKRLGAYQEALSSLSRGLALLAPLPESPERIRLKIRLQLALSMPLYAFGWRVPEREQALACALELAKKTSDAWQLAPALVAWASFYIWEARFGAAVEIGEQILDLARRVDNTILTAAAHRVLGIGRAFQGDLLAGRDHLEHALALYDSGLEGCELDPFEGESTALVHLYLALVLAALGYPEQAMKHSEQALDVAQTLHQPFILAALLLLLGGPLRLLYPGNRLAAEYLDSLMRLAAAKELGMFQAWAQFYQGYDLVEGGHGEDGMAQMRAALAELEVTGTRSGAPLQGLLLARAFALHGRTRESLEALEGALAEAERTAARYHQAEMYRLMGELLLDPGAGEPYKETAWLGSAIKAEACFCQALALARQQSARWWELRAALSLGRLWQREGRCQEAFQLVSEIYTWFTEGFDMRDLQDARTLLDELAKEDAKEGNVC